MHPRTIFAISLVSIIGIAGFYLTRSGEEAENAVLEPDQVNLAMVAVSVPSKLTPGASAGKTAFDLKCAVCHGKNGEGQNGVAPPLIHKIYEPSHHGDESFQRAVKIGVRSHHWKFGDMAPIEGLTRADVSSIIVYIRELQRANGIN